MKAICAIVASLMLAGTTFADTINVPGDYPSIQSAIDASSDGDIIQIEEGTYFEYSLNPNGKAITVRGSTTTDGSPTVTIDAMGFSRVIMVDSGETSTTVFENMVITNGFFPSSGGGIRCDSSSPTLRNCTIVDNNAQSNGGGIFCYSSNVLIIGCTIKNNSCLSNGGGVYCFGSSNPRIINTIICGNNFDQIYGDYMDLGGNIISDSCLLLGACCIDSTCTVVTQEECEDAGGSFQGIETDCDDDPCYTPPVEAACCTNDQCVMAFEDDCLAFYGQWLGDGTNCDNSFCATTCLGDANTDGIVNVNDILIVISEYGVTCP